MKFLNFFLLLWDFALLDPDPDTDPLTRLNPDPIQIRIRIRNPDFHFLIWFFIFSLIFRPCDQLFFCFVAGILRQYICFLSGWQGDYPSTQGCWLHSRYPISLKRFRITALRYYRTCTCQYLVLYSKSEFLHRYLFPTLFCKLSRQFD